MDRTQKIWLTVGISFVAVIFGLLVWKGLFLDFVENYQFGIKFNKRTGEMTEISQPGWTRVTPFITEVYTVDTRPMQIRIEANNRVLNARLVKFNPKGWRQFIKLHGLAKYDGYSLSEILKSYAYENVGNRGNDEEILEKKYTFLEILSPNASISSMPDSLNVAPQDTLR